ncbi:unnamed protein product [Ilex paraguariensis]|uniref:Uncharacterized protein n=1 Tax=Ilex paraguariensis TaxID=185542 RepID=A0ABC8UGE5_9AQUA
MNVVQVNRHPSALYKSYDSYDEAENALRTYIENEDVVRDVQHECEVDVHQNQPLPNICVEDAMDIPLAAPIVVGRDAKGDGNRNVGNYLMYGDVCFGMMTAQHFKDLVMRVKRRLPAICIDQIDLVKISFFWKKKYFTIKAMLKTRMFAWDSVNLCVVEGPLAGARDYLLANKFAITHCIDPCPLFEKMVEVFDNVSPEELIKSVGSCSGGYPAEDIEIIDISD